MTANTIEVATAARQQSVDLANEGLGLSAEPATYDAYTEAIITCPADLASPTKRKAMSQMSACGLRELRCLDAMGVEDPLLRNPYEEGKAIENVQTILHRIGAIRPAHYVPLLGDTVTIQSDWHVFRVTKIEGNRYTTVQGGERTADKLRAECIEEIVRTYTPATETTPAHFDGREVYNVGDAVTISASGSGW